MLTDYLKELRTLLEAYRDDHDDDDDKVKHDIEDILSDYEQLYQDALATGLTDEQVVWKLGTPTAVVKELGMYIEQEKNSWKNKVVAISPFLAVIAFFVVGTQWNAWHPGWLVFLIIPVTAIALNAEGIFAKMVALSPFAAIIAFFTLLEFNQPEIGWLTFLAIPMLGMLGEKIVWRVIAFETTMIIAIALYVYLGPISGRYEIAYYPFLLVGLYFLTYPRTYTQFVQLFTTAVGLSVILSIVAFVLIGLLLNGWYYAWLVFLAIPMVAIIRHSGRHHRLVALTPFIATIIFFALGFLINGWQYAWLAFLIIPMTAILTRK